MIAYGSTLNYATKRVIAHGSTLNHATKRVIAYGSTPNQVTKRVIAHGSSPNHATKRVIAYGSTPNHATKRVIAHGFGLNHASKRVIAYGFTGKRFRTFDKWHVQAFDFYIGLQDTRDGIDKRQSAEEGRDDARLQHDERAVGCLKHSEGG